MQPRRVGYPRRGHGDSYSASKSVVGQVFSGQQRARWPLTDTAPSNWAVYLLISTVCFVLSVRRFAATCARSLSSALSSASRSRFAVS